MNEAVYQVEIYVALLVGEIFMIEGGSASMMQGRGTKVYPASLTPARISNEEMLELITAPSSVVLGSKTIAPQVRVVKCKEVERIFCIEEKRKLAAVRTEDEDWPAAAPPYVL